jgi:hypothetical protein
LDSLGKAEGFTGFWRELGKVKGTLVPGKRKVAK